MKNVMWFLAGVAGGFVVAHYVYKDPRGREVLANADARVEEFTQRLREAYEQVPAEEPSARS